MDSISGDLGRVNPRYFNDFWLFANDLLSFHKIKVYDFDQFHKDVIDTILSNRYTLIILPRGHLKTTLLNTYALWRMLRERRYEIGMVSSTLDQTIKNLTFVQDTIETTPWLKHLIPEDRSYTWNKSKLTTTNGNVCSVLPFKPSARGAHPNELLYDDIMREKDIDMDEIKDTFWHIFFPMGQTKNCKHTVVGCVSPDTLIYQKNGLVPIGDMTRVGLKNKQLLDFKRIVLSKEGWATTSKFYINGLTDTRKIVLVGGYELECSLIHPLWACEKYGWVNKKGISWIKAKDLKIGDFVAVKAGANVFGKKATLSEKEAYFYGLYIAEGSSELKGRTNRITITNKKLQIISFLKEKFDFNNTDGIHNRKNSKDLVHRMKKYGLPFVKCTKKWIPKKVLREPKNIQIAFLQGLYDGDGSSTSGKSNVVNLTSTSKKLLSVVQQMLLNFGIFSYLVEQHSSGHYKKDGGFIKDSISYRLGCTGFYAAQFMNKIGFRIDYKNKKFNCSNRYKARHKEKFGFIWKRIKKIETGKNYTVDFVIPKFPSFVSNGMISHNTPISAEDLFVEIQEKANKGSPWKVLKRQAIEANRDGVEVPLWNSRFSLKELAEIKEDMGTYRFNREFLCDPLAQGAGFFPPEMVLNATEDSLTFNYKTQGVVAIGADFAMSESATGDYNCFTVIDSINGTVKREMEFNGEKVTVKVENPVIIKYIDRWKGPTGQARRLKELSDTYRATKVIVDISTFGQKFAQELREMGVSVDGQDFRPANRNQLLVNLRRLFESDDAVKPVPRMIIPTSQENFTYNKSKHLLKELSGFRETRTKAGSMTLASNLSHDDTVMSLALAVKDVAFMRSVPTKLVWEIDEMQEKEHSFKIERGINTYARESFAGLQQGKRI